MIEILNRQKRYSVDLERLRLLLDWLTTHYRLVDPVVTLALVTDAPMRDLNRRFLGKNAPTDVLSFPIRETAPDGRYYLGDIVISVPFAARQSRMRGHGLQRELEYLTIHGLLHLKGFEHFRGLEKEEKKMRVNWMEIHHGN